MSNQPLPITLNDLAQLTLRGNVAFAVRCAQRLRPCFQLPADASHRRERTAAVDGAIRVATAFCRGGPVETGQAAAAARLAGVVADETGEDTRYAGYAAVRAAEAAAYAEEVVNNLTDANITAVVAAAFGAGRVLAANADAFTLDLVVAALRADMEKLLSLAPGDCKNLGSPVDPSEGGPLGAVWPDTTPYWCAGEAV